MLDMRDIRAKDVIIQIQEVLLSSKSLCMDIREITARAGDQSELRQALKDLMQTIVDLELQLRCLIEHNRRVGVLGASDEIGAYNSIPYGD
jgi:hypothetical protein